MSHPLLFIIVLNNNHRNDTLACLESLIQSDYENAKIILVDNVSADGDSFESIRQQYTDIQIIPLTENLGYAGNNNIGIKAALEQGAEWIFILNDDTVLDPACLSSLVEVGMRDPAIGIVGPMVYHFDEPNVIQSAGGMLGKYWQSIHLGRNELDHGQFNSVRQVQWISGCAILVRRALIEEVGMLDAEYFLYWEETEWCIRAGQAGWKIFHVPYAKLWHKGVNRDYQPKPYVTYYVTRNYLFTLAKHNAPFTVRISALIRVTQTLLSWSIRPKWRIKRDHRNAMWQGLIDFLYHRTGPMPS
ncbi:MAG: glycosyltransferase family 2 protein [Chloroflexota bacterium]